MAKGLLSPQTVQRAAGGMAPGKFRTVGPLGRGQFTVADRVVGNMGTYAGEMARKLPTHTARTPGAEYKPIAQVTNKINKQYGVPGQAPPIAPYVSVGRRGAFQQMATGHVPQIPPKLKENIGDLHHDNLGPGGQIIDFSTPHGSRYSGVGNQTAHRTRIDPGSTMGAQRSGPDIHANLGQTRHMAGTPEGDAYIALRRQQAERANQITRRYWETPLEQRRGYMDEINSTAQTRYDHDTESQFMAAINAGKVPRHGMPASPPNPIPPEPVTNWHRGQTRRPTPGVEQGATAPMPAAAPEATTAMMGHGFETAPDTAYTPGWRDYAALGMGAGRTFGPPLGAAGAAGYGGYELLDYLND